MRDNGGSPPHQSPVIEFLLVSKGKGRHKVILFITVGG